MKKFRRNSVAVLGAEYDLAMAGGVPAPAYFRLTLNASILDKLPSGLFLVVCLACLTIGSLGIKLAARQYQSRYDTLPISQKTTAPVKLGGLNLAVAADNLDATINKITSQPVNLSVGSQTVAVQPDVIKSWLNITVNQSKSEYNLHIKQTLIGSSLLALAKQFEVAPINQVSVTHDNTTSVVVNGRNGLKLTDPSGLNAQALLAARHLFSGQGLSFNTPASPVAFSSLTPANFNKLIEVNVNTKQMYLYDNGQLTRSYPISAGAPATPTPLGEFHIFEKFAVQDMKGFNADGTPYFQPHVHYINYFLPGGYAIHGNYWRPLSWFGVINSSHGCVSLPDDQAAWVYSWAPIGTTVITHA